METVEAYNRTISLLDKYTKFIRSINTEVIESNLTLDKLIELKSILSDINNIMTLISTRSIATKLSDILSFKNEDREQIFNDIDKQKPNTNGFDIRIDFPVKILVEIKCNSLIHNNKFGAAQINAILEDARKLRLESSRHIKASKSIQDTKDYIKIIAIVNFGNRSDEDLTSQLLRETKCKESTNSARKERMKVKKFLRPLYSLEQIHEITDLDNIYLTVLSINDLKNELERIRREYSLSLK
ncbi:hypothetical protein [Bacteroides acidifaciens]|uniref:hypothetical protein n=1 Tax=Bacteroides acidifaciens TaxID=85831 RepID=UPI0023D28BEA|nr:hypothetical protein [Bacteroides acidifaciens]MDE6822945.1 hypothetical protein [Bacteroides acidifaciens]